VRLIHGYFVSEIKAKEFSSQVPPLFTQASLIHHKYVIQYLMTYEWQSKADRLTVRNTTWQENKVTAGGKYEHLDREWFRIAIQGCFE